MQVHLNVRQLVGLLAQTILFAPYKIKKFRFINYGILAVKSIEGK